jgi:RNA polymerase sigma-70 factor (ECF subfamily)
MTIAQQVAARNGRRKTMEDQSQKEFEALLHSHKAIVFKVANTYCWHSDDRADLAQEIAAQLWRGWPRYDPSRTFTTWMYRIALNVAISFVRKEVQHRKISVPLDETLHDTTEATDTDPVLQDRLQRLAGFIDRQAPLDRALLLLYLEDRSQREISEILGITPTNVSTKISRLKQRIRTEI